MPARTQVFCKRPFEIDAWIRDALRGADLMTCAEFLDPPPAFRVAGRSLDHDLAAISVVP